MSSNRPGRWKPKSEVERLEDDLGTNYECMVCRGEFRARSILANHKHSKKGDTE